MPDKWVVSWERTAFVVPMGGRNIQPRPERKAFDSQKRGGQLRDEFGRRQTANGATSFAQR
jgi:hypothetical protein